MRILTWNIDCKTSQEKDWNYIINEIKPDIALLQECSAYTDLRKYSGNHNLLLDSIGGSRKWGSAICTTMMDMKKVTISDETRGWVTGAEIILSDGSKTLVISIHTKLKGVFWVVPGLKALFQIIDNISKSYDHVIIGGDLNAARSYDEVYPSKNLDYQHALLFDWLDSKWCNCSMKYFGKEIQTVWGNSKHPYQNDYIFVDKEMGKRPFICEIPEYEMIKSLSDHSPVIVEL